MYDFLDRRVAHLDEGGRFLVWSMRVWVKVMGEGRCPFTVIAPAFARWKMIGGLPHFHRAMALFNRDALETLGFSPLPCNHVSEHEALILSLVCSLRDGRPETVCDTLALLVEEDSVGDVLAALTGLGLCLAEAGIFPQRVADTAR